MEILSLLMSPPIPPEKKPLLKEHFFYENIRRCKLFASIVAVFEVLLIILNLYDVLVEDHGEKVLNHYFILYILLLAFSVFIALYIHTFQKKADPTEKQRKWLEYTLFAYIEFFLI